jgi:hypothetical protein
MGFFNDAGPVDCTRHYCLDPLHRIDLEEIEVPIGQQRYCVLHAPRQIAQRVVSWVGIEVWGM